MSTAACIECGSLRTRKVRGSLLQHVVAFLRRQDVVACDRCGRRGRLSRVTRIGDRQQPRRAAARPADRLDLTTLDEAFDSAPHLKERR